MDLMKVYEHVPQSIVLYQCFTDFCCQVMNVNVTSLLSLWILFTNKCCIMQFMFICFNIYVDLYPPGNTNYIEEEKKLECVCL